MQEKQSGDTFKWKDVPFVVINTPIGRVACPHCDLWVGGFCVSDEDTPSCLDRGIAFKCLDNRKFKKLTTKNKQIMKCREVSNRKGEDFVLTEDEERYVRALERLSKMNPGRIRLMANGTVSVRINDQWHDDNIDAYCNVHISCEGGDGGDNY